MKKKRQEIHRSTLNARWAHRKAISYFTVFICGLSSNNGVLSNGCAIHCVNTFPYYHSTFKRRALLSQSCSFSGYIYVSGLQARPGCRIGQVRETFTYCRCRTFTGKVHLLTSHSRSTTSAVKAGKADNVHGQCHMIKNCCTLFDIQGEAQKEINISKLVTLVYDDRKCFVNF